MFAQLQAAQRKLRKRATFVKDTNGIVHVQHGSSQISLQALFEQLRDNQLTHASIDEPQGLLRFDDGYELALSELAARCKRHLSRADEMFVVDETPDQVPAKILDNLFVGSQDAAVNHDLLKQLRITHVLNVGHAAVAQDHCLFKHMHVPLLDVEEQIIDFAPLIEFIDSGNRCLVHCNAGVSRSVSVCIAYLMQKHEMNAQEALDLIRKTRKAAKPNAGFWKQLLNLQV